MQASTTDQTNPSKLTLLREKLGRKAKEEPTFRFYSLYGHLLRKDVLTESWRTVRQHGKTPGVDNLTFEDIETQEGGVEAYLEVIHESLRTKTYQADPVKRVYIPKPNGKQRPLGIPTVKDRIVQTALLLILVPIFESDFKECSYGYRPNRSAHQAIQQIKAAIEAGYTTIFDADLQGYFDSIPHDKLMKALQMRIADRHVLKLIRMWLKAPISEKGQLNKPKRGTPQGGVISALLANIYLHWFDEVFHRRMGATYAPPILVRYADDFVILMKHHVKEVLAFVEEKIENWLGLTLNRDKTKTLNLEEPEATLSFLGYTFSLIGQRANPRRKYCYLTPSKEKEAKAREKIRTLTASNRTHLPLFEVIQDLNQFLRGWNAYFKLGSPSKTYRRLNTYLDYCVCRHVERKSQRGYRFRKDKTKYRQLRDLGLIRLRKGAGFRMP